MCDAPVPERGLTPGISMSTNFSGFVGEVQHRIDAGDQADAVRTTRAVLTTLGERVVEGGATDIAGPLPLEIDRYLLAAEHGHTYDYDAFIGRKPSSHSSRRRCRAGR